VAKMGRYSDAKECSETPTWKTEKKIASILGKLSF
jgi:hypothetical protein